MELKCKYLIDSTEGWPTELVIGCLQLEVFVDNLDGVEITNSISDSQPSYSVYKEENGKVYEMTVDPRIRDGKLVYFVRDYFNNVQNLLNEREDKNEPVYIDFNQIGGLKNPHRMNAKMLQHKIENIDLNEGYVTRKAS